MKGRATARRVTGVVSGAIAWVVMAVTVLAASPSPAGAGGGDPRSSGQGPGLVGDPLFALVAVLTIGLGTVAATLIYVRLTSGRGS